MNFRNKEKRRYERKNFISKISVLVPSGDLKENQHSEEHALAMDVCDNGLSFYIDTPVRKRQNINITRSSRKDICKHAVVRWVRKFDKRLYKAGLMYVE